MRYSKTSRSAPFRAQRSGRRRALLSGLVLVAGAVHAGPEPIRVYAAVSLKGALDRAVADWRATGGAPVTINYAGTPALARQIEQGAPADVFLSADAQWMDWLSARGGLRPQSRREWLGNRLVLIAPARGGHTPDREVIFARGSRPPPLPAGERLALADTRSVPAGRYAQAALDALAWSETLGRHVAMTDNVRAALLLVARGEAALGIVYASDAAQEPRVRVLGVFAPDTHPQIRFPGAVLAGARHPQAQALLDFFGSEAAWTYFAAAGFSRLVP